MERLSMCRICLTIDVQLCSIARNLQHMYERITATTFKREDRRPLEACYICHARLQNCYRLRTTCLRSENLLTRMQSSGVLVPQEVSSTNTFGVVSVLHLSLESVLPNSMEIHINKKSPEVIHDTELNQQYPEDIKMEPQEEPVVQIDDDIQCSHLEDPFDVTTRESYKIEPDDEDIKLEIGDTIIEENKPISAGPSLQLADNIRPKIVKVVSERMDLNHTTPATENMSHPHLSGLEPVSEHTSGSSVISLIPAIKTSQTDRIRFYGMIGYSDDSNDTFLEHQKLFSPRFETSEQIQTNVATAMTDSDVGDFSPSNESDFDPKKASYNSDDRLEKSFDDEYYDDPVVDRKKEKKERKRKGKRLQERMIEENVDEKSQNLLTNEGVRVVLDGNQDSGRGYIEKYSKQIARKRKWDRRNACFYCQAIVTNYSRHLLRNHSNETEVMQYKAIDEKDPKIRKQRRQEITDKLRNKANFLHNSKVSFDRDPKLTLLPSKRSNQGTSSPSNYATCKTCLGTFKRSSFFRHLKNCKTAVNFNPSLKKKSII